MSFSLDKNWSLFSGHAFIFGEGISFAFEEMCFFLWCDSKRREFAPMFFFTYICGLNLYGKDEQNLLKGVNDFEPS